MGRLFAVLGLVATTVAAAFAGGGFAAASPTAADEAGFVSAVMSQGYSGGAGTLKIGYKVCSMLDDGMSTGGLERYVADTYDDRRDNAEFYAALFSQYAAYHLCPRHMDQFGNI